MSRNKKLNEPLSLADRDFRSRPADLGHLADLGLSRLKPDTTRRPKPAPPPVPPPPERPSPRDRPQPPSAPQSEAPSTPPQTGTPAAGFTSRPQRSAVGAGLLSFILCGGGGQLYLGQTGKGSALIAVFFIGSCIGLSPFVSIVGAVDAYSIARRMNRGEDVNSASLTPEAVRILMLFVILFMVFLTLVLLGSMSQ